MAKKTYYGGQAVIEGVMMRGQTHIVTAVRRPDGGISLDQRLLPKIYIGKMRKTPLLRGVIVMAEAVVLGIKTLLYSANISLGEEEEQLSGWSVWVMTMLSAVMSVGLFFIIPLFLAKLLNPFIASSLVFHLVEGVIRLAIFVAYLKAMTLIPDIKRVFAYHGAEHKTVNAYEAGVPLEISAVKAYSTAHVRCGTSFLFVVMIVAILVFAIIGRPDSIWLMVLSRILLIPVIASLGYEVTYFSGRHTNNRFVRTILYPGLLLQNLTTREPDDSQLEVGIAALRKVIEIEQGPLTEAPADLT